MATTELTMTGLTCGHCVASVTEEISELPLVTAVDVDLVKDGVSTATVTSDQPVNPADLRAAVEEAGYEVVSA